MQRNDRNNDPELARQPSHDHKSGSSSVPGWVLDLSARYFVLPEAWDGWAVIHEKPCHIFAYAMCAGFFAMIWNSWALVAASLPVGWVALVPCIIYSSCHLASHLLVWRHGPMISKAKVYRVLVSLSSAPHTFLCLCLVFWPGQHVPFGSHILFTAVLCVGMWPMFVAAILGCWAEDHPSQPHRCITCSILPVTSLRHVSKHPQAASPRRVTDVLLNSRSTIDVAASCG